MKVSITSLKAPWGDGAKIGSVVEFEVLPPWAVGKCAPVGDDASATHTVSTEAVAPSVDVAALQATARELTQKLADAEAALAEQGKKLADAEAALAAATKKK